MSNSPELISIFVPSLEGGGAERIMVIVANGLVERGYRVDLVLINASGPYLKDVSTEVRIVELPAKRVFSSIIPLANYLRRNKPNALLSAMAHANVIAVIANRLSGGKTRVVVSERAHFSMSARHARNWRGKLLIHFVRWAYPRAQGVIAISGGVADDLCQLLGMPRERVEIVYNPVLLPKDAGATIALPNHPWFLDAEVPVLLGMGRLVPQKDFRTLIRAVRNIRRKREVRLLILGEGYLRDELELLIKSEGQEGAIELAGFEDDPKPYLKHASLFVFSSRWEGFGNVLVETMALGTPVVSTDCPSGPSEILEQGKWGRLVAVGDVDAMAMAIEETLDQAVSPNVARRAEDFGVDQAVDGYLQVLLPHQ